MRFICWGQVARLQDEFYLALHRPAGVKTPAPANLVEQLSPGWVLIEKPEMILLFSVTFFLLWFLCLSVCLSLQNPLSNWSLLPLLCLFSLSLSILPWCCSLCQCLCVCFSNSSPSSNQGGKKNDSACSASVICPYNLSQSLLIKFW